IFALLATVLTARNVTSVQMLFLLGSRCEHMRSGLNGVLAALAPLHLHAPSTYLMVTHPQSVLMSDTVISMIAGTYYYFPLVIGRKLSDRLGKWAFWLMFAGFNIAFLPMHASGLMGMPRRIYTYHAGQGFELPNLVSTLGAFVLAAGFAVLLY